MSAAIPDDHPLAIVRRRLAELGRPDVRLIAVSKTHGPERIAEFLNLGQRDFGESRQNEARDKFPLVRAEPGAPAPIYHHIGPLQSSGARQIPGLFHYVHGAGSLKAIQALAEAARRQADREAEGTDGRSLAPVDPEHWPLRYLIQIRLTDETSKVGGMLPEELRGLEALPEDECVRFAGLMTMGPGDQDPTATRETFHRLRELRDEILPGGELSMGMSGDWEIAVSEGATMIRLGTILFGPRRGAPWKPPE